jgi:hypothetical protein
MSPKPRVLICVGLPATETGVGVAGAAAAETVGQPGVVGVTSLMRSIVRVFATDGRSAKVMATRRPAAARSVSMAGNSQRFSMYMRNPPLWVWVRER